MILDFGSPPGRVRQTYQCNLLLASLGFVWNCFKLLFIFLLKSSEKKKKKKKLGLTTETLTLTCIFIRFCNKKRSQGKYASLLTQLDLIFSSRSFQYGELKSREYAKGLHFLSQR